MKGIRCIFKGQISLHKIQTMPKVTIILRCHFPAFICYLQNNEAASPALFSTYTSCPASTSFLTFAGVIATLYSFSFISRGNPIFIAFTNDNLQVNCHISPFFSGNWATTIATIMNKIPIISLSVNVSLRKTTPQMALNTDSKLISSAATVGSVYFCAVT